MSPRLRIALTFTAAAVAAFAAYGVLLPDWASALLAALSAGLAGIGILPPQWLYTGDGNRAVKRSAITPAVRNIDGPPPPDTTTLYRRSRG